MQRCAINLFVLLAQHTKRRVAFVTMSMVQKAFVFTSHVYTKPMFFS
jgi:hypothetical protein